MSTSTFAFYSAGGFTREVASAFRETWQRDHGADPHIVFVDDDERMHGTTVNGYAIVSYDALATHEDVRINVAFADPALRRAKHERAAADGYEFFSVFAPSFRSYDDVTIGEGAIFADNTMVTCNAKIGVGFHCNIYSYVAHDCVIGDFVTFAPRVALNGRIVVEDNVYIGTGATFLPGNHDAPLVVGEGAIVGAGALVTKDVPAHTTVIGAPAKPLVRA